MRKIEQAMMNAVKNKQTTSLGNTFVEYLPEVSEPRFSRIESSKIYLHGHSIATYDHSTGKAWAHIETLRLWPTATTKSRLRALGVDVYHKKGILYLYGNKFETIND